MNYIIQNKESEYNKVIDEIIENKKGIVFDFFNSGEIELPFNIYIYNTIEDLVNGLNERGLGPNPSYMCACHKDEDNSLNFFEPKDNPSDDEWSKEEYKSVIFHELIHGIEYTLFGNHPEWLTEGIAKYLDGEYTIDYVLDRINNNPIPNQDEIINEFGEHDYNSYYYSYIMVGYLIDTLGKDKFIEILNNISELDNYTDGLLINSINYYNDTYKR